MIQAESITKNYGEKRAVDSISFEVGEGEVVGFLGPNGAGKTTVLRMLSTYLPPSSGKLSVAGHDVSAAPLAVRRSIGYLPEHDALFDGMRVRAFLHFCGEVHGLDAAMLAARTDQLIERYGVRIPVVRLEGSKRELGWPFSIDDLFDFLNADDPSPDFTARP